MIKREADGWYVIFAVEGPKKVIAPAVGDETFECQTAATRLSFQSGLLSADKSAPISPQAAASVLSRGSIGHVGSITP